MQFDQQSASQFVHPTVAMSAADMVALLDVKDREIIRLRRQVAWFQRQIFGQKSERRLPEPQGVQGTLGEPFEIAPDDVPPAKKSRIAAHEREHKNKNQIDGNDDSALFFEESKVPVEVIAIPNPDVAGLDPADF
jgi:transposase